MKDERKLYIVTLNEWFEVESLGKSVHPETERIYYDEYLDK